MANDLRFFKFTPGERWHYFDGYAENQYFVDPFKLMLTTPDINSQTGNYENFGVTATILANYLREQGIIPEKCDLNLILFLLTPAESMAKMQHLVAQITHFEQLLEIDTPLADVLPTIYRNNQQRYQHYTIRQLCQEMHDLYAKLNVKPLQKEMFRQSHFPAVKMLPQAANIQFVRGQVELIAIGNIAGRIAVEGELPYPPGVLCVVPKEVWGGAV
ncbi:hypothetical protein [Arsenophonus endosymbiont of Aleurodicus floccissimus]|uniref:Orn/Lys/Arg family decarboxylase n=1 Tax=Arsenophonus endosymbiont of Aleurodicus floccissimus TaxID=2152761 RepID=UPI001EDE9B53